MTKHDTAGQKCTHRKLGHLQSCFLFVKQQNILTLKENEVMLKTTVTAAVPHSWTHILSPFISPSSCWHHNRGSLRCRSIPSSITLHLMPEPSTSPGGKTGDRNHNVVKRLESKHGCILLTPITLPSGWGHRIASEFSITDFSSRWSNQESLKEHRAKIRPISSSVSVRLWLYD